MKYIAGQPAVDGSVPAGFGRGYVSRDYKSRPLHCLKMAGPTVKRMTDAEILEAIAAKTAAKSWITDLFDREGMPVKNQQSSSYCWVHAATRCCEAAYMMSGGPHFVLAAFDQGALIKGGWDQGGSGIEAIESIAKVGICVESLHKPMDFTAKRTPEQAANAALHKITAYDDIDPSDYQLIASYVCNNIAVSVGIPAWRHEVEIAYLVAEGGTWYFGIENSWGPDNYGDRGRGVLHGVYSRFDEAGAVRAMTPAAT